MVACKAISAASGSLLILSLTFIPCARAQSPRTVADARAFMSNAEAELLKLYVMGQRAEWVAETYITGDTEILTAAANEQLIKRTTELVNEGKPFEALNLPSDLRRKFLLMKLSLTLPAPSDAKLREELTQVASSLSADYGKGKYCPEDASGKCFGIDDLEEQMAKVRDPKQLAAIWAESGRKDGLDRVC
jgi:peptidyl-dipeptidase A